MNTFNQIKPYLKTGDIIMFTYKNHQSLSKKIQYYLRTKHVGSPYGHTGIVYRDSNGLYLYECCGQDYVTKQNAGQLNDMKLGGVRKMDLETYLNAYTKKLDATFAVRFVQKAIPNDLFLHLLEKYTNHIFEDKSFLFLIGLVDLYISRWLSLKIINTYRPEPNNRMMCSEFVYDMLYRINYTKEYPSKLFLTAHFTKDIFDKLSNITYSELIEFVI